ncbi:kynureninase [Anaeromyxobacter dehalogenans 2CP-1]|uniref:Kynureninase n=1 Tax=Anaeromyxobacter dehalogenans (strain ATCC BAA-258 / DSM 21875 / 2CP-1) TaxID=455488 RepID=B8JHH7_ANAD2|nr:kynureninase [Anaeromyxobacter dehalogenans]ACL66689.1 kynureninase [Anaeromyxobacter dehalogenans 2CP-1]
MNPLARHYTRFRVAERLLLTGHSHQAWPDVAREGVLEAFEDAAREVDGKWGRALAKAERVREGFRALLADPGGELALGGSTHELVLRFLSALDLRRRRRLVTTDGEFHTLRRQLARLGEDWLEVEVLPARPVDTLAERLAARAGDRTAAVLVSAVLYEDARIVPGLGGLAEACAARGVELLVDAYHALGAMPFALPAVGLGSAWIVGGGYKYLQLGEGNCFLRLPPHARGLRPAVTGWYAEFDALADAPRPDLVPYGRGAAAFAGSTYDPTSHYRAARVMDYFGAQGLTPEALRASYRRQVDLLAARFDALGLDDALVGRDRSTPLDRFGAFLALDTPRAAALQRALVARGVLADSRGRHLRLGPAPYLDDAQLEAAIERLGEAARELRSEP